MRRLSSKIHSERGFSLIEVVASIVIIGLVLISFSQLFIQSNKTAVYNNEKLVLINLAHAELERTRNDPFALFSKPSTSTINATKSKIIPLNNRNYNVTIKATQSTDELKYKIFDVLVTVKPEKSNSKSSVEGYVVYD